MMKKSKILTKWNNWWRKHYTVRIRKELSFWGVDLSGWTDEEIEQSVSLLTQSVHNSMLTVGEATQGLYRMFGELTQVRVNGIT